jgi:hypothetical protein
MTQGDAFDIGSIPPIQAESGACGSPRIGAALHRLWRRLAPAAGGCGRVPPRNSVVLNF